MKEATLRKWHVFEKQCSEFLQSVRLAHVVEPLPPYLPGYALVVTKDDDVFAMDSCGEKNCYKPRKVLALCQKKITFFCYHDHMCILKNDCEPRDNCDHARFTALNEDGQVFAWRRIHEERITPILVNGKVVQVAANEMVTLALTDQGELFSWPISTDPDNLIVPKRIVVGTSKVMAVACTLYESFAVLKNGSMYLCMDRQYVEDRALFDGRRGKKIRKVVCGYFHCLALTDSGQIFAFGYNHVGQLGTGNTTDYTNRLVRVTSRFSFSKAVDIAASGMQSVFKFDDGSVRVWGYAKTEDYLRWENSKKSERRRGHLIDCATIDEAFAPYKTWRTLNVSKNVAQTLGLDLNDETADVEDEEDKYGDEDDGDRCFSSRRCLHCIPS